jgi:Domain of unknown function (DUF4129)
MESNAGPRTLRTTVTVLGVLASVAVVAVVSRGDIAAGEDGGRKPSETLVDVAFTLYLVLLAVGAVFFVYLLALQKRMKREAGITATSPLSYLVILVVLLVGLLAARRMQGLRRGPPPEETLIIGDAPTPVPTTPEQDTTALEPGFSWPALVLVALLLIGAAGIWWASVRRRRAYAARDETALGEALADVLEESLDDLRAERDPRRAVIRTYARLERVLAAHGIPRRPSDAPLEYLSRVLVEQSVSHESARRLTQLFERAKFSDHEVGSEMKDEALAALQTMQDELRAAEALARQERERAARAVIDGARVRG